MTISDLKRHPPNYTQQQISDRLEQASENSRECKIRPYTDALETLGELGEYRNIERLLLSTLKELSEPTITHTGKY